MQDKPEPMKAELILRSRREMFYMARTLASALPNEALHDESRPLLVSVRGSLGCGKKIIADAMREYLTGTTAMSGLKNISGREGYDEYWLGIVRGKEVELAYIDAAWLGGYSDDFNLASFSPHMVRQQFMWQRTKPGVAFVHNDFSLGMGMSSTKRLAVWVEQAGVSNVDGPDRVQQSKLAVAFENARLQDPDNQWLRYVEVNVDDDRLLNSPKFCDAMKKLTKRYGSPGG